MLNEKHPLRHGDEVMSDEELAKFLTQEEVKGKLFKCFMIF